MTSRILAASLVSALLAFPAMAQGDRITLLDGTVVTDVRVASFDIRNLKYKKGSTDETVSTDRIAKVELAKYKDVFARGLRDPDILLTQARNELTEEKNPLLAQFGFVGAASLFLDSNDTAAKGVAALDELQKAIPEAGVLPDVYRLKFEYYMGIGPKGAASAATVAKKYANDAAAGAWPTGLGLEAEFFLVLAERATPKDYQAKLRAVIGKSGGNNPTVTSRANVELGHSLREDKDVAGAKQIYEEVLAREGADLNARAGALLGLGKITFESAGSDKEAFKKALLMFLRVRLDTKGSWPSLQAEALYYAILAADKWRGPEFGLVMGRCRGVLLAEYGGSEWADRAKAGR
jgi:hypothetical protein